ncbi:MAG: hypothetical protein WC314_18430 [Vulcanimicrobiota bacterium]
MLLLVGCLLGFALVQVTPDEPWSPPYLGGDLGWSKARSEQAYMILDPRGLESLQKLPFLPHPLPRLKPGESWEVTPGKAQVLSLEPLEDSSEIKQFPRVLAGQKFGESWLQATLYQPRTGIPLLSGPIKGQLDLPFYRPIEARLDPHSLSLVPADVDRLLAADPGGLHLEEVLRNKLIKEWKQWEFEPYVSLADAFQAPFCFAEWQGRSLVMVGLDSLESVEAALRRRFPPNVIKTISSWSHATGITGFEKESGPAWMLRGENLVATPDGGTDFLEELLTGLYSPQSYRFRPTSPLLEELSKLARTQSGWHLFVVERQPAAQFHWGVLLRWPQPDKAHVEGHMVVWIPPVR